jgi:hypothetical protein
MGLTNQLGVWGLCPQPRRVDRQSALQSTRQQPARPVLRGPTEGVFVRCAHRNRNNPDNRNDNRGFRVVLLPHGFQLPHSTPLHPPRGGQGTNGSSSAHSFPPRRGRAGVGLPEFRVGYGLPGKAREPVRSVPGRAIPLDGLGGVAGHIQKGAVPCRNPVYGPAGTVPPAVKSPRHFGKCRGLCVLLLNGWPAMYWPLGPHHPLASEGKVGCWRDAPSSPRDGAGSSVLLVALGEEGEVQRLVLSSRRLVVLCRRNRRRRLPSPSPTDTPTLKRHGWDEGAPKALG